MYILYILFEESEVNTYMYLPLFNAELSERVQNTGRWENIERSRYV